MPMPTATEALYQRQKRKKFSEVLQMSLSSISATNVVLSLIELQAAR
jgi:hypothetical protein